jgi:hypothetical protein
MPGERAKVLFVRKGSFAQRLSVLFVPNSVGSPGGYLTVFSVPLHLKPQNSTEFSGLIRIDEGILTPSQPTPDNPRQQSASTWRAFPACLHPD